MTNASRFFVPSTLSTLIGIPILGGLMILQTSLLSRFPLLEGTSDLVMLAVIAWALQKHGRDCLAVVHYWRLDL